MNSFGAVEPIPARGRGGALKKELDRADAIIDGSAAFRAVVDRLIPAGWSKRAGSAPECFLLDIRLLFA